MRDMNQPLVSMVSVTAGILGLALLVGCSGSDLYCTSTEPCKAGHPVCDVEGVCSASDFIGNTCIPEACWDAGLPPADAPSAIDANGGTDAQPDAGAPPEMVQVPAGAFEMGCSTDTDTCASANETPLHTVTLPAFEIDRLEVTQERYAACVTAGSCTAPAGAMFGGTFNYNPTMWPQHPTVMVHWQQAVDYCSWAGKRLPTEAEWEKAARGTDKRKWPWGNEAPTCTRAQLSGCGTLPAVSGAKPAGASPYGALDMAGNVHEWVADYYADDYYANSPSDSPQGPGSGAERGFRGGGYVNVADAIATTRRNSEIPNGGNDFIGFRCARTIQ